ncbi:MAG: WG repeat-containing protein [Ekhidna sp.]|nr:WG repeat-containing protein [Ekhidna sp.]
MLFVKSFCILFLSCLIPSGTLHRIQKALDKNDFEKAEALIIKGYQKEPDNPGVSYLHAKLLFMQSYNGYDPDSAQIVISKAKMLWEITSLEVQEALAEEDITIEAIDSLTASVRNYLFKRTLQDLSVERINDHLERYPNSPNKDVLIFKRDSIDFEATMAYNTKEAYIEFIASHPFSGFAVKADSILDFIRYSDLAENGVLNDYYVFRSEYPLSRHISKVEAYILKVSTVSHDPLDFETFIKNAKTEKWKKRAGDLLFFIDPDSDLLLSDSLKEAKRIQKEKLIPTVDQNGIGFLNESGTVRIENRFSRIQEEVKCKVISDSWIFAKDNSGGKIILKDGSTLFDQIQDYRDLSKSVGMLRKNGYWYLFHKSGFQIIESSIESAEVFDNHWIKVRKGNKWGLYTLLGFPIAEVKYEDIYSLGDFWVFERNSQIAVYTEEKILKERRERRLSLAFEFDDIELIRHDLLIGFRGDKECLLNNELKFLIPWGDYEIFPDPSGWFLKSDRGYFLYDNTDERVIKRDYPYLESNEGWLALQTEKDWILISRRDASSPTETYDSIKLINPYAALLFQDNNKNLLFSGGKLMELKTHSIKSFPENPEYLSISNGQALGLYNKEGVLVFEGDYDEINFLTDTLLRVEKRGKLGLISTSGEFILDPIFDGLDEKDGLVTTLNQRKIGCYDLFNRVLIRSDYNARITRVGPFYSVKKGNRFGLVDSKEDEVISSSYDEITQWNDTSYVVKKEELYQIINTNEEALTEPFSSYELLFENSEHKIFRYVQEGKFGMRSNNKGEFLHPEFTDILNIGTRDKAIFLADQHLNQAKYHVVSYLNESGELLFSNAYREEEFEKIICDD